MPTTTSSRSYSIWAFLGVSWPGRFWRWLSEALTNGSAWCSWLSSSSLLSATHFITRRLAWWPGLWRGAFVAFGIWYGVAWLAAEQIEAASFTPMPHMHVAFRGLHRARVLFPLDFNLRLGVWNAIGVAPALLPRHQLMEELERALRYDPWAPNLLHDRAALTGERE